VRFLVKFLVALLFDSGCIVNLAQHGFYNVSNKFVNLSERHFFSPVDRGEGGGVTNGLISVINILLGSDDGPFFTENFGTESWTQFYQDYQK
jgi:hypothetical protein